MTTELAEWDWVALGTWRVLHHAASIEDVEQFEDECAGRGVTSCGVHAWLSIPGVFSRMAAPRCKHCCRKVGYPEGDGSPKNDARCRPLVEARLGA